MSDALTDAAPAAGDHGHLSVQAVLIENIQLNALP
jgi:hypothetical protein